MAGSYLEIDDIADVIATTVRSEMRKQTGGFDGEAFGNEMVLIVRGYVQAELESRDTRIAALEARLAELEELVTTP